MKIKTIKGIMTLLTAVILVGALFTACDNGGDSPPQTTTPQSVTYVSTDSEGNLYTLEITENLQGRSARYAAKTGDSFKFTVELFNNGNYSVALTYSGTIDSAEGNGAEIELRITVNGEVLDITISGSNMTVISGNIVDEDGDPLDISDTATLTPVADKTLLGSAITAANTAKQGVAVSVNGSDIETTVYWVTQTQMDSFNTAIATAQAFFNDSEADQSMINSARITLVAATTVFNGQKKLGTKTVTQDPTYDVYVAGSYSNGTVSLPCYWKNGVKVDLPLIEDWKLSDLRKIVVSNGDVYVIGTGYDNDSNGNSINVIYYWKNQVLSILSDSTASDIVVLNGDVYIVGSCAENSGDIWFLPAYWKNGERIILSIGSDHVNKYGSANYIAISNNTVHIIGRWGYYDTTGNYTDFYCYWNNGSRTDLNINEGYENLSISGFALSGNDIYLSGWYNFTGSNDVPCYWKNGVRTNLPSGFSSAIAQDIFVNNVDVHTVGYIGEYQNRKAYYWKNNQSFALAGGSNDKESYANAITVIGNDVFIAGSIDNFFDFENSTSGSTACYWRNGTIIELSENASASGIFVVER